MASITQRHCEMTEPPKLFVLVGSPGRTGNTAIVTNVVHTTSHKRIGLVLASEKTYPGASLGIAHQIQEFACYTYSRFVGVVHGIGNSRGEVTSDPSDTIPGVEQLGREIFEHIYSDYRLDTQPSGRVWSSELLLLRRSNISWPKEKPICRAMSRKSAT
jgi:hypothetical protein